MEKTNYEKAKAILLENKSIVWAKWYNTGVKTRNMKVCYCNPPTGWDAEVQTKMEKEYEERHGMKIAEVAAKIEEVDKQLQALSTYTSSGSMCSQIYHFNK